MKGVCNASKNIRIIKHRLLLSKPISLLGKRSKRKFEWVDKTIFFQKKIDFSTITDAEIQRVEDKLNNRLRKRLNFEIPLQEMEKLLFIKEIAFYDFNPACQKQQNY